MGPSPRVRGSRRRVFVCDTAVGSIPACAGKPAGRGCPSGRPGVHPRVCGEARHDLADDPHDPGPSPRVRGSLSDVRFRLEQPRSIPACAGKPGLPPRSVCIHRVHPRVCGEAIYGRIACHPSVGPSPRVRGSQSRPLAVPAVLGSIPACAGKPSSKTRRVVTCRVHPRVCGEAAAYHEVTPPDRGPSPRVRGSPLTPLDPVDRAGSIPACAGKPYPGRPADGGGAVHPRVCGEAFNAQVEKATIQGPSPRVRGSRPLGCATRWPLGSIPACAGKPRRAPNRSGIRRVHPRVCGEATIISHCRLTAPGPSPRVRGSLT